MAARAAKGVEVVHSILDDTRRLTYEGEAIDFAEGKIYKELEVVKL